MKRKTGKVLCIAALMIVSMLSACKKKEDVILYDTASMQAAEQEAEASDWEEQEILPENTQAADGEAGALNQNTAVEEERVLLLVHICGAVRRPGVYEFEEDDRLFHAVERAGGFLPEADTDYLNQAWKLSDGMQICIPTKEQTLQEASLEQQYGVKTGLSQWESTDISSSEKMSGDALQGGVVNINTASKEILCTLPGIGEGKAQSIIDYRDEVGGYGTIEEIMNVDGIKEGLFEKIKSSITV